MTAPTPSKGEAATDAEGARRDLVARLQRELRGTVDDAKRRRAEYSTDASNYRVVPDVVVFPETADDIVASLAIARETATPLAMRGGGTSIAGNSIGPGIVLDTSRAFNRILDLDPIARTARVEPGVIMGALQRAAAPHGLRFGPDPSTWARASIGGMIGNNACGAHSLSFGRTSDNVIDLDVIDGMGRRFTASDDLGVVPGLEEFTRANLATFRTELGRFERQVSGYGLEHLLPERGHNLARALVGTEGTCAIVLGATVRLVDVPKAPLLVVLGYRSMYEAADAVPVLLEHSPGAIEGLDARLVDAVRRARGDGAVEALPDGAGWLLVELSGEDERDTEQRARRLVAASGAVDSALLPPGQAQRAIWRIREDGAGLAGRTQSGNQAWPGFEDAAVPPEQLGAYLRDFDAMLEGYGIEGMPYGHFGDGCIHVRLDIPLDENGDTLRAMMVDAAKLIASYGGSLSGEHGDGRARSELLPYMYSDAAIASFKGFKHLFDPENVLNPGVLVDPHPLDADLRRPAALNIARVNGFAYGHDKGSFTNAVHRCVGVGKCRVDNTAAGGFMCPSYIATADEKDSTRGRARVLQEMVNGSFVKDAWRSEEVRDALELCLSCKACSSDCPAGVDMAAYKSEVLHNKFKGRIRPITHYVLGWLPRWARLVAPIAPLVNAVLSPRPIQKLVLKLGGMDTRRSIPKFAGGRFTSRAKELRADAGAAAWGDTARLAGGGSPGAAAASVVAAGAVAASAVAAGAAAAGAADGGVATGRKVLLWVDSFSDCFSPAIAESAVAVLRDAGYDPVLPQASVCCGLTWITTGQLDAARRKLTALVKELHPYADAGMPILGLEPSCTAVLRSDLLELLPGDERARSVAKATVTLAELLAERAKQEPAWQPPSLEGERFVVQPHCHHHAVMGYATDRGLLASLGAEVTELAGCCGLAGNFGMEQGHYDVSVKVAENAMLPALRSDAGARLLADGFSCRTQADQLADRDGEHLAQVLAAALAKP
ncbi:FAD-binding and (Fe-S)-binding domain-containing protein [Klugiella sp. YN-L-19]|uniref:FAD-binding and (Fe-S)-binding domain-containing protein n=2 Tax=Ruicaihuangia caeni TaxID=3042517 RepID=A0AAW6T6D7_9MICO|nr:FAD-binding and (Fe-S)-binding domain-containing protein [Klugiella sp. YN-L-19]MDI2098784.1 FAD-binding and (Fe-S)-binding domain-containing protein [Klugiella sp. YN-L-19]